MAERRMFSKSITNSSIFLKMPISSRLLYYDLGMNADDDGFVEHFMVLRMTGASEQDLGVLELNGLIKILDDNVLWIKDWKVNNSIKNDRYKPSKYLTIYKLDTLCIQSGTKMDPVWNQNGDTGKDSIGKKLGKDRLGENNIDITPSSEPDSKLFIELPLIDKTGYPIYEKDIETWKTIYPAVNIEQEIRNMYGWLDSNPKNRKTKSGIRRFINSWLSRSQNTAKVVDVENNTTQTSNQKINDPNDMSTWTDDYLLEYVNGGKA